MVSSVTGTYCLYDKMRCSSNESDADLAQTEEGNNSAIATCRSMATDAFTMQIYKLFLNGVLPVAVIFVAVPCFSGCAQV